MLRCVALTISSTTATRSLRVPANRCSWPPIKRRRWASSANCSETPGLWTFTATSSPECSRAVYKNQTFIHTQLHTSTFQALTNRRKCQNPVQFQIVSYISMHFPQPFSSHSHSHTKMEPNEAYITSFGRNVTFVHLAKRCSSYRFIWDFCKQLSGRWTEFLLYKLQCIWCGKRWNPILEQKKIHQPIFFIMKT